MNKLTIIKSNDKLLYPNYCFIHENRYYSSIGESWWNDIDLILEISNAIGEPIDPKLMIPNALTDCGGSFIMEE